MANRSKTTRPQRRVPRNVVDEDRRLACEPAGSCHGAANRSCPLASCLNEDEHTSPALAASVNDPSEGIGTIDESVRSRGRP